MNEPINNVIDLQNYFVNIEQKQKEQFFAELRGSQMITRTLNNMELSEKLFAIKSLVKVFESNRSQNEFKLLDANLGVFGANDLYWTLTYEYRQLRLWKGQHHTITPSHVESSGGQNLLIHLSTSNASIMERIVMPMLPELGYTNKEYVGCFTFRKPSI